MPYTGMKTAVKAVIWSVVAVGVYAAIPQQIRIQLPSPRWVMPAQDLKTVSLEEALAAPRSGYVTVTFLYLSDLPPNVAVELAKDVAAWRKKGVNVRGYSIDPVRWKADVPKYVRNIGLDVAPVWIEMPDGAACAFKQMEAVKYFTGLDIDPQVTIPLLTLALTDRDGHLASSYAVKVPNGVAFDPSELDNALMSFNNSVTRVVRAPR
jgi:hypothetical protein